MDNGLKIHILGVRGSLPVSGEQFVEFGGATTCYIVRWNTSALIIDCGTGLYNSKEILRECTEIYVMLTHAHYDHILGLLDWSVFPPDVKVKFIYNLEVTGGKDIVKEVMKLPFYPVTTPEHRYEIIQSQTTQELPGGVVLETYPTGHCAGAIMGIVKRGKHKVSFLFDYESNEVFDREQLRGSEVLFFDGMFTSSEYSEFIGWGHSHWETGCALANEYNIGNLLIMHHKPRSTDEQLRFRELLAKKKFKQTRFVKEMDLVLLNESGFRYIDKGSRGTEEDMHFKLVVDRVLQNFDERKNISFLDAIDAVLAVMVESIKGEAGTFWLCNYTEDGIVNYIYPKTTLGHVNMENIRISLDEGIAGSVISNKRSVLVKDCKWDAKWQQSIDNVTGFDTKSIICVPMCVNGFTFGCIQILNKKDGTSFTKEEVGFVETLLEKTMNMFADNEIFIDNNDFDPNYNKK